MVGGLWIFLAGCIGLAVLWKLGRAAVHAARQYRAASAAAQQQGNPEAPASKGSVGTGGSGSTAQSPSFPTDAWMSVADAATIDEAVMVGAAVWWGAECRGTGSMGIAWQHGHGVAW